MRALLSLIVFASLGSAISRAQDAPPPPPPPAPKKSTADLEAEVERNLLTTPAGAKAILSHTSSLASSTAVWDAMVAQTGAIGTATMEETVDVTAALTHTNRPRGRGMALIGMNGGQAVALTDQFSGLGFEVPSLSEDSYAQLAEFFVAVGSSYRNPFDAASTIRSEDENLEKILDIIASDDAIDGGVAIELGARDFDEDPASIDRILDLRTRIGLIVQQVGCGRSAACLISRLRFFCTNTW